MAKTVGIEYQGDDLKKHQKCLTLPFYICHQDDILDYALELVKACMPL